MRVIFTSILVLLASLLLAQEKGFIRGNVTDGEFSGPMIGATVVAYRPTYYRYDN
jgi:hypothetical protein